MMEILLIDKSLKMVEAWQKAFANAPQVTILEGDLTEVIGSDAIVSPANSFGFMDGGIDQAISERLGWDLQDRLQAKISKLPTQELLIGQSITLETGDDLIPYLIASPTMRVPMNAGIPQSINGYLAMKATLIAATEHANIQSIAVPGFCTGVGRMPHELAANQMHQAFQEIVLGEKLDFNSWHEAQRHQRELNPNQELFGS